MKSLRASKCTIVSLDGVVASAFIAENHRDSSIRGGFTNLGLIFEDELIAVIQFGYPRTRLKELNYSVELYRLAFKKGVRVHGGASKLIKHYIREYKPADFFTYQDTSGEATKVYEHAGMTLVSQAKKKLYLVAPGKTRETGSRKEVLGMAYATRYGPDRILGSKLGEVYREDGTRKSNKDLFIEELGWHLEETSGDRVYEWIDPDRTYYTYKITASDSDKYYYGVSHVKKANATAEDCLNDGYMGSGSAKFKNWRKSHRSTLKKEILRTFSRRSLAFNHESSLIGELYRDDPLCLNSTSGGKMTSPSRKALNVAMAHCAIHGETKFQGSKCKKCSSSTMVTKDFCEKHGEAKFLWNTCSKCSAEKAVQREVCEVHGETAHRGGKCVRCYSANAVTKRKCPNHGLTVFRGDSCASCAAEKSRSLANCSIHGEVPHRSGKCLSCKGQNHGIFLRAVFTVAANS